MASRIHYGEDSLAMCRSTRNPSAMTMNKSDVTCKICLDHLERGIGLRRERQPVQNDAGRHEPRVSSTQSESNHPETAEIMAYTDGAAEPNPGTGGYGAVIYGIPGRGRDNPLEVSQGYRFTTNNRMELMGAIVAIESVPDNLPVKLFSDSQYVVNGINKLKKSNNIPEANNDLWERIKNLIRSRMVTPSWVRGHAGNSGNERADFLAVRASHGQDLLPDTGYLHRNNPVQTTTPAPGSIEWKQSGKGTHWCQFQGFQLTLMQFSGSKDWRGMIFEGQSRGGKLLPKWENYGLDPDEAKKALEYETETLIERQRVIP